MDHLSAKWWFSLKKTLQNKIRWEVADVIFYMKMKQLGINFVQRKSARDMVKNTSVS